MEYLSVSLLGPFVVAVDGQPALGFKSDRVRALLAYLAVEADRPHRRETLAGLLWPDYTDRAAFNNLRDALANLRTVIHDREANPPFLYISSDAIQFNLRSHVSLDVHALEALSGDDRRQSLNDHMQEVVDLSRGQFLEGFSIRDASPFEEWVVVTRDRLGRQMWMALHHLAVHCEQKGDFDRAALFVRRQLQLDPLQEESHQHIMRLLALSGQRSAALAQYDVCRRLLAEELGVEPERRTTEVYERIRDGKIKPPEALPVVVGEIREAAAPTAALLPAYPAQAPSPVVVAREMELSRLGRFLDLALEGHGQMVFVTGEAGAGKTATLGEFLRRAMQAHGDVLIAEGRCNAYTGSGDPYLPFGEIMQMLTGDIEAKRAAGNVSPDHARRLWEAFPLVLQALVDLAPDCLDLLLPGESLVTRARAFAGPGAPWLPRLDEMVQTRSTQIQSGQPRHVDLFGQYTALMHALARQAPLILVVDDLQWADTGSISLLFHLGRRLAGSRIMIVGAYRRDDVALGGSDGRHPLETVVHELQRDLGDIVIDLDKADGRRFIAALLDSEPNRLGAAFRETLFRHTSGQPLFTVELLRGLQEQGDLAKDSEGRWVENGALSWDRLPARAEAVIAERLGRLSPKRRALLTTASVEGEEFIAEVVARVQGEDEAEVVRELSAGMTAHNLVRASSLSRVGGRRLSQYRFGHYLVQRYLYNHLDGVERARLHEAIGNALEAIYGDQPLGDAAIQLAWHFEAAGLPERAVPYLLLAGERAVRLSAHPEAIARFTHGLDLLAALPDSPDCARLELALQLALCAPVQANVISASPEHRRAALRAFALSQQVGSSRQIIQAAYAVWSYFHNRAEYQTALESAERILSLANTEGDPLLAALGHAALGHTLQFLGDLNGAYHHLEQVLVHADQRDYQAVVAITGWNLEVACMAHCALVLQALGYPDQALRCSRNALLLAESLGHPYSRAEALASAAIFHAVRGDPEAAQTHIAALTTVAIENGFPLYQAWAMFGGAWQDLQRGQPEHALAGLRASATTFETMGYETHCPLLLEWEAQAYDGIGQAEDGLRELNKALACMDRTGASFFESEAWRLRGELLLAGESAGGADRHGALEPQMQSGEGSLAAGGMGAASLPEYPAPDDAEECFLRAVGIARLQQARWWELRASVSLGRFWLRSGRAMEAQQLLGSIHGWFSEGLDSEEMKGARLLLDEMPLAAGN